MQSATRVTVGTFGVLAGLAGIEHGIGEILQGHTAPEGLVIASWPAWDIFRIVNGEPALTIVPNLLLTGILAIVVSLILLVWVTLFVQRKHAGAILILLSLVLLLVGGGFGPPLLGLIHGIAATRINAPLAWWHRHLSRNARLVLSSAWPRLLVAGVVAWLLVMPGAILLDYFVALNNPDLLMIILIVSAFGLLLLTIVTALPYDVQTRIDTQQVATVRG